MTGPLPQLARAYNREVRAARRIERAGRIAKIVLALALALGLAMAATAAMTRVVATQIAHSLEPWEG